MTKWIKIPDPGQFRGEGKWKSLEELRFKNEIEFWEYCAKTGYLPTAEQEERPDEQA